MTGETLLITTMSIAAFGTVVLGLILRRIRHLMLAARRARRWPAVPGVITHSEIAEANHQYRLLVTYEYHVGPTPFRCARVSLSGPPVYSFPGRAERALAQVPPGTEVTVRYDPARPGIGVIDPRAPALATLWLLFGFMAALCVALIALVCCM